MTAINQVVASAAAQLPSAAWDLLSFLDNAKAYATKVGGGILLGLGVIGVIVGGVFLLIKLFGSQQSGSKHSWGQIAMLILIGGAMSTGGVGLMMKVGSGGETTIRDLGGGTAIAQSASEFAHNASLLVTSIPGLS